jgi:hypothetical protein
MPVNIIGTHFEFERNPENGPSGNDFSGFARLHYDLRVEETRDELE